MKNTLFQKGPVDQEVRHSELFRDLLLALCPQVDRVLHEFQVVLGDLVYYLRLLFQVFQPFLAVHVDLSC